MSRGIQIVTVRGGGLGSGSFRLEREEVTSRRTLLVYHPQVENNVTYSRDTRLTEDPGP